jgi:DUF4097 and DUF4098 domain-containing protein YvlB
MKRLSHALLPLTVTLAFALTAAAERIERLFPASEDVTIEFRNLHGQVTVQSWNRPQVQIIAVRRSQAVETHLEQGENRVHVHTHLLQSSAPAGERSVDYEIWAPPSARLHLYQETGTLRVESFFRDVTVETVAASVYLRNVNGHTSVKTLNGSVTAERCTGRLDAASISGTLRFLETDAERLVANTTSGDIFYQGDFQRGGSYDFINHEGRIELLLPATASFELDARSVQGEVVNELPLRPRSHGRVPQGSVMKSLLGTVHTGAALVRATSFSGTIRLRKQ